MSFPLPTRSKRALLLLLVLSWWSVAVCFLTSKPVFLVRTSLFSSANALDRRWYPRRIIDDDDVYADDDATWDIEERAVKLACDLIKKRFNNEEETSSFADTTPPDVVKGRFMDLTCDREGEKVLESLFFDAADQDENVLLGATMVLQSLLVMGTQCGVKGPPEKLRRLVAHLDDQNDSCPLERDLDQWDSDSVRRLKFRLDKTPALQLLSQLHMKRSAQGAFNLLVGIGAWKRHENLALLSMVSCFSGRTLRTISLAYPHPLARQGFPVRFSELELEAADEATLITHDPDQLLGLRQDLTHLKVFTIDSASTSEVDDGISLERVHKPDGSEGHRIWIHIADTERWASTDSPLFEMARKRITSLYLPMGSISMLPASASTELMSLKANKECCALSMAVELNDDGSVDPSSIMVTPSLIRVSYRLTYEEVDEMLEEGIGYSEEWELGALLHAATKRRAFRIACGSTEGVVPNPIPFSSISTYPDKYAPDGIGISHNIELSHNSGKNQSAGAEDASCDEESDASPTPVSSAYLLVTETMILAGEAAGRWKALVDRKGERVNGEGASFANPLRMAFRTQPKPGRYSACSEYYCFALY
jgi:hypothetical protein